MESDLGRNPFRCLEICTTASDTSPETFREFEEHSMAMGANEYLVLFYADSVRGFLWCPSISYCTAGARR